MSQEKIALNVLVSLGLSTGEAKTYLALAMLDTSEATPLADYANVPQSKIYQYLSTLETKYDIVTKLEIEGKPNQYHALSFDTTVSKLRTELEKNLQIAKEYVESQKRKTDEMTDIDYLRVVLGERAIKTKLEELITQSSSRNFIALGVEEVINDIRVYFKDVDIELLTISNLFDKPPPIFKLLNATPLPLLLQELKVLILIENVNFVEKTASSFNIIGYPNEEMEIEPLFIQIKHPIIRNFQIKILLTIIEILSNMGSSNIIGLNK